MMCVAHVTCFCEYKVFFLPGPVSTHPSSLLFVFALVVGFGKVRACDVLQGAVRRIPELRATVRRDNLARGMVVRPVFHH